MKLRAAFAESGDMRMSEIAERLESVLGVE